MVTSNKKSLHSDGNAGFINTRKSQVLVMLLICMCNRDRSHQKKFISSVRGFAHTLRSHSRQFTYVTLYHVFIFLSAGLGYLRIQFFKNNNCSLSQSVTRELLRSHSETQSHSAFPGFSRHLHRGGCGACHTVRQD